MSFQLPFGVRVLNPQPVENKYFNNAGAPYTGTSQVLSQLTAGVRHVGLTVNVNGEEYWFKTGTTNGDLVLKIADVAEGGGITGATNGLTKTGAKVKLGGALTGDTEITGSAHNLNIGGPSKIAGFNVDVNNNIVLYADSGNITLNAPTGPINLTSPNILVTSTNSMKYAGNYSASFTPRSLVDKAYVTGLTTTSGVQTANNGLTKSGSNVRLGGTLTGATTINALDTSNRLSFGAFPVQYGADYSANFTDRSLVDKAYVDSIAAGLDPKEAVKVATVAAITGTYNPTGGVNGTGSFTSVSTTVVDGYTLVNGDRILVKNQVDAKQNGIYTRTSATVWTRSLDMDGTPAAEVSTGNYVFVTTGTTQVASGWVIIGDGGVLTLNTDDIEWVQFSASISAYIGGDGIDITGATIDVDLAPISGLEFNSGELRAKVDNGIKLSSNGAISLGGTLTGNTTINITDKIFVITGSSGLFQTNIGLDPANQTIISQQEGGIQILHGNDGLASSVIDVNGSVVSMLRLGGGSFRSIFIDNTDVTIASDDVSFKGAVYQSDYSTNYVNRSLVDKAYVDTLVSNSSGFTANNGLTKSGNNIYLGGTLTGDTTIGGDTNAFGLKLGSSSDRLSDFEVNVDGGDVNINIANGDINIGNVDQKIIIDETADNITIQGDNGPDNRIIVGASNISILSANDNINIEANGGVIRMGSGADSNIEIQDITDIVVTLSSGAQFNYNADYSANFTERSFVDAAFVTGLTSNITVNKLSVAIINSSTTLTSAQHVVLVNTSGVTTITLPSTPNDGQVYHIKDRTGNALTNNITIDGDTNNIDGAVTATINTNYGSLYVVYSATAGAWFTLAYIS